MPSSSWLRVAGAAERRNSRSGPTAGTPADGVKPRRAAAAGTRRRPGRTAQKHGQQDLLWLGHSGIPSMWSSPQIQLVAIQVHESGLPVGWRMWARPPLPAAAPARPRKGRALASSSPAHLLRPHSELSPGSRHAPLLCTQEERRLPTPCLNSGTPPLSPPVNPSIGNGEASSCVLGNTCGRPTRRPDATFRQQPLLLHSTGELLVAGRLGHGRGRATEAEGNAHVKVVCSLQRLHTESLLHGVSAERGWPRLGGAATRPFEAGCGGGTAPTRLHS